MSRQMLILMIISLAILLGLVWLLNENEEEAPDDSVITEAEEAPDQVPETDDQGQEQALASDEDTPTPEPDDEQTPGNDREEVLIEEPDWHNLGDVDTLAGRLEAAHEDGNPNAAYYLHELAMDCQHAVYHLDRLESDLEEADSPGERQNIQERLEKLSAMQEPCRNSRFETPHTATQEAVNWVWHSAERGHPDAMYDVVFGTWGSGPSMDDLDHGDEETRQARRQEYAQQLRDACHADGLYSMGVHLSRDSGVTEGLEMGQFTDVDGDTAQQMEGFAHRYAAALVQNEPRPAHAARRADHALTSAEEMDAQLLAEQIVQECD
ncbi:hypothetical protein J2T60_001239 [Natronospira proteinivora]|uniref:Sel1 repeat family protein n=1 Tax=Natronospira proteinivora TaxID=1807133 RepID=A0ABT1G7J1_9GAMM|nr:hypothetical protein [Natronospira proteinivora]MCP1727274.1 hypothetical protein [Natronospira proteinivora]